MEALQASSACDPRRRPHNIVDALHEPLHVILVCFNPVRYRSRWTLYHDFEKHGADSGAVLHTIEAAFGERDHAVSFDHPNHTRLRTGHELWLKENLINLAIQRLPSDWKYVAWVDADVTFARPNWVHATLHALQHYHVVQMFSEAHDLSPDYELLHAHRGFCYSYEQDDPREVCDGYGVKGRARNAYSWHPGFAWAARREAIDALGGLIDFAVLGSADNHMAKALIGDVQSSLNPSLTESYRRLVLDWQDRAEKHIRRNIGYVPGLLLHHWHGRKADRRYRDRWKILIEHGFDPHADLKKDWQGLWQLTDRSIGLRDDIRHYFRQRREDSIDV